jgi:hypothetical protein
MTTKEQTTTRATASASATATATATATGEKKTTAIESAAVTAAYRWFNGL